MTVDTKTFSGTISTIVPLIPGAWEYTRWQTSATIIAAGEPWTQHTRKPTIHFYLNKASRSDRQDKIVAKPIWPRSNTRDEYRGDMVHEIEFNPCRPSHVLAADIQRRLIAPYLDCFPLQRGLAEAADTRHNEWASRKTSIAKQLGVKSEPDSENLTIYSVGSGTYLRVHQGGTVTFEIRSLPQSQADRLVALLAEFVRNQSKTPPRNEENKTGVQLPVQELGEEWNED